MLELAHFLTVALDCIARPGIKKPAFHRYDRCPRTGPCAAGHQRWEQRALTDPDQVRWYRASRRGAGCNVGIPAQPAGPPTEQARASVPVRVYPSRWDGDR